MEKKNKRLTAGGIWMVFLLLLLVNIQMTVSAAEKNGSITLVFPQEAGADKVTVGVVKTAQTGENGYVFTDAFQGCGQKLSDLAHASKMEEAAARLEAYALAQQIPMQAQAQINGNTAAFWNLTPGLYLVVQMDGTERLVIQSMLTELPRMENGQEVFDVTVTPKYVKENGAVIAVKVDEEGHPLKGAHFALEEKKNGSWKRIFKDLVSAENGQIVVKNLPFGEYRFVETKAPEGYRLLKEAQTFTVSEGAVVEAENGVYKEIKGHACTLSIVNEKEPDVPDTPGEDQGGNPGGSPGGGSNVKTGDSTAAEAYMLLMTAAAFVCAGTLWRKKAKNR